jgi:Zn-dependent metalloprotease
VVVTDGQGRTHETITGRTNRIAVDTKAGLTKSAAEAVARKQLSSVEQVFNRRLVIFAGDSPKLAYEVNLSGVTPDQAPANLHVFVDANNGAVLDVRNDVHEGTGNAFYNGNPVTINTTRNASGTFSMVDSVHPGISCGQVSNRTVFSGADDVWGNGTGTSLETACVDTLYDVQREWDMLRTWLGRNGINGQGRGFPAFVGLNQVNAFWNGRETQFGHSQDNQRQATPMDVVGHEFGHAIFQTTPGGAGSGNENGGLNESDSDIFGALTEAFANNPNDPPDYTVGEEVNLVGRGPIRFMYQPSLISGHPDCFSSAIPNTEVHAGAGPQNHFFYLLAEGTAPAGKPASPTCNNSPRITGIGILKAGQIYYNGLLRKTSAWNYRAARLATVQAAKALFPNNSTECNTTKAAWSAVSVPAGSTEPAC